MAQHSNYAKDRDLMMEAYSSVEGRIPPTQSTAPARMFNESGCASHSDEEDGFPADMPSDEFFELLDDVMMEVGSESYQAIVDGLERKLGRELTEREAEEAKQGAQEDELPELREDNEGSIKREVLEAIKAKAAEYGGRPEHMAAAAQELAAEYTEAGEKEKASLATNQGAVFATYEGNESEATMPKTLEELEDIVHAILDKRDSEERAEEHYR